MDRRLAGGLARRLASRLDATGRPEGAVFADRRRRLLGFRRRGSAAEKEAIERGETDMDLADGESRIEIAAFAPGEESGALDVILPI